MAVISTSELQRARQAIAADQNAHWTKPQINAAIQAVEDLISSQSAAISAAINTATSPVVLTAAEKKAVVREWAILRFRAGG
jgi:hypothetical protein